MEENLLSDHPIQVVLLATDLQASKEFYAQKVGLEIMSETDTAVTFKCGGGTRITVLPATGTADEQTQASWQIEDLASELAELRSRGVEIVELDTPELKTENGSWTPATSCMPGSWTRARTRSGSTSPSEHDARLARPGPAWRPS